MCPACVASVALTAAGATSSGGVLAFVLNRLFRKTNSTSQRKRK
jgi:hypothetical protein